MQTAGGWLTLSASLKILDKDAAQPAGLPTLYGGEPVSTEPGEQLDLCRGPRRQQCGRLQRAPTARLLRKQRRRPTNGWNRSTR